MNSRCRAQLPRWLSCPQDPKPTACPCTVRLMAKAPALSVLFTTQRLDCKLAPRVVSARKDLAVSFAVLPALQLCHAGWLANGTCEPFVGWGRGRSVRFSGSHTARPLPASKHQVFFAPPWRVDWRLPIEKLDLNQYFIYSSKLHSRISVDYDIPPDHIGSLMP